MTDMDYYLISITMLWATGFAILRRDNSRLRKEKRELEQRYFEFRIKTWMKEKENEVKE